jgi:hypothetical protein
MGSGSSGALAAAFGIPKPNAAPTAAIPVAVRANWRRDIRLDQACTWPLRHRPRLSAISFRFMFSPYEVFGRLEIAPEWKRGSV